MKNRLFARVLAIVLCLCPALGLAGAAAPSAPTQEPVTHSDFTLSLSLHPEGFPESTALLRDWETFLSKLSVRGYLNALDFLQPYSRVYASGGLYVNEKNRIPFVYDGYHSYRYLISPAIRNESAHFQMHNFFQFMLKPYYFMGLPTQYIALLLYPEASYSLGERYYTPVAGTLRGEGTRTVPYDELYALAEELNLIVNDDPHYERAAFYLTALLVDAGYTDIALDKLADLGSLLDFLDPEQEGMTITVAGNQETYVLGDTTVFQREERDGAVSWALTLPDPEGYLITLTYQWTPSAQGATLAAHLVVTLEEEKLVFLGVDGVGLPQEGDWDGQGRVVVTLDGAESSESLIHMFDFRWDMHKTNQPFQMPDSKQDEDDPFHLNLDIDWLHPLTAKPALSLHWAADMERAAETVFVEGSYPQEDFFNLNDSFLEEYKERYLPTLALAFTPVALEMPLSVVKNILQFATETGLSSFFGLE